MQLLLTNDDGIEADGLLALAELLSDHAEVVVVAPEKGCSCCGHSVTTNSRIPIREVANNRFAVGGWPVDCVRVAIKHLKLKPDWVLSGINHGGNLGVDVTMSGTVAAAREARLLGIPSVAISQYRKSDVVVSWPVSASRAFDVFRWIADLELREHSFWNLNLPAIDPEQPIPSPSLCPVDPSPFEFRFEGLEDSTAAGDRSVIYRSDYHRRPRVFGSDVSVCFSGIPSVSELTVRDLRY